MKFIYSIQSEWLKTKRSAASWLCLIGGFFIPTIYFFSFIKNNQSINGYTLNMWEQHFVQLWSYMAGLLLPMGVILASSLITQMEYKNNTWKQLHTTPQSYTSIFFSKFSVIILMTVKFFIFFNIGILLSGIIPCFLFDHQFPKQGIPIMYFLKGNLKYFITCLPIIAIQYLISLKYKNFLIPIGAGLVGLIGTIISMSWKYIFISPYSFCPSNLMSDKKELINIYEVSFLYFIIIMVINYALYITKKEKG
jgi:hypothetical protein